MKTTTKILIAISVVLCVSMYSVGCRKDEVSPNSPSIVSLTGVIRDSVGVSVAGALVVVPGGRQVSSNSNGGFTLSAVPQPYDLIAIFGSYNEAIIYRALTRSDPTIQFDRSTGQANNATIVGQISDWITDNTGNDRVMVAFVNGAHGSVFSVGVGGTIDANISWFGPTTITGKLFAFRTHRLTELPEVYYLEAYASTDMTILAGVSDNLYYFPEMDLNMRDTTISGTATLPPGYQIQQIQINPIIDGAPISLNLYQYSTDFTFNVPVSDSVNFGLKVTAADSGWGAYSYYNKYDVAPGSSNLTFLLDPAPQILSPPDNASQIDTATVFTWSKQNGGSIFRITFLPVNGTGVVPTFIIYQKGNNLKLPNLLSSGLGMPSGVNYQWYVENFPLVGSVDNAASETFGRILRVEDHRDWRYQRSDIYHFKTK